VLVDCGFECVEFDVEVVEVREWEVFDFECFEVCSHL